MNLPQRLLLTCVMALAIIATQFTGVATALAGKENVKELICEKPVKLRGPGNLIQSVAELQTIIAWSKSVTIKFDGNWSHWHNARAKRVKCLRTGSSQYFYCELSAIPCANKQHVEAAKQAKAQTELIEDAPYIKKETPAAGKKPRRNPRNRKQ